MKSKSLVWVIVVVLAGVIFWMNAGPKEAEGYAIGVVTGTTFEQKAREFPKVTDVKLYEDDNQTLSELSNERVDAVITDRLVGLTGIKEGGYSNLDVVGDLLYQEVIAVVINKENDSLRQAINRGLDEIIADGTYAQISQKYFGRDILEGIDREKTFPDEPAATDDSWEKAKEHGELSFAMSGGYPPFNYYNSENELTGFDVEIARAVCEKLGVEYKPVTTAWDGIIEGLRTNRYDGIWGSMAVTDERLKVVDFTDPYYISGAQLVVRKGSEIAGPQSLL